MSMNVSRILTLVFWMLFSPFIGDICNSHVQTFIHRLFKPSSTRMFYFIELIPFQGLGSIFMYTSASLARFLGKWAVEIFLFIPGQVHGQWKLFSSSPIRWMSSGKFPLHSRLGAWAVGSFLRISLVYMSRLSWDVTLTLYMCKIQEHYRRQSTQEEDHVKPEMRNNY